MRSKFEIIAILAFVGRQTLLVLVLNLLALARKEL